VLSWSFVGVRETIHLPSGETIGDLIAGSSTSWRRYTKVPDERCVYQHGIRIDFHARDVFHEIRFEQDGSSAQIQVKLPKAGHQHPFERFRVFFR